MANRRRPARLTGILAIIATLIVTMACGALAAEKIKLTIYSNWPTDDTLTFPVFQQYLREYERLNPHVEIVDLGRSAGLDQQLTMLLGGAEIDMIGSGSLTELYEAGFIAEVPPQILARFKQNLFPVAIESGTIRGRAYGIPAQNNVLALYYNKRILNETGQVPNPPVTWNDLAGSARKAVKMSADGNRMERVGFYMQGPAATDTWAMDFFATTMFFSEGGKMLDSQNKLAIDGPQLRLVLNRFKEWYDAFMRFEYWDFARGRGAYMLGFSWQVSDLRKAYTPAGAYKEDIGLALVPAGAAGHRSLQFGNMYGVVSTSKHQDEVWKLLEWLYFSKTPSGMTPMGHIFSTRGYPPIHRDDIRVMNRLEDAEYYMAFIKNLEYAVNLSPYKEFGLGGGILAGAEIQSMAANKIGTEQAMANIVLKMQTAMDKYAAQVAEKNKK